MDIKTLWKNGSLEDWENAVSNYSDVDYDERFGENTGGRVLNPKETLDWLDEVCQCTKVDSMTAYDFETMSGRDFYRFLIHDFALWYYPAEKRKTFQCCLERFHQEFTDNEFEKILCGIFSIEDRDIYLHFFNITRIKGIETAGASGLLSLVFPDRFGKIDKFVVKNLKKVYDYQSYYGKKLKAMNPDSLTNYDAIILTQILREKARQLNEKFDTSDFTPRKIDMALWAVR